MTFVFSFLCSVLICALIFPLYKQYQLEGYNLKFIRTLFISSVLKNKTPLKFTRRMQRFIVAFFVNLFVILSVYFYFLFAELWAYIVFLALIFPLCIALCALVHMEMLPIEHLFKEYYVKKARMKLKNRNIIKIGITGSYGKTTTKNILKTILSKKFKVCATPSSYNTPMGLTRTVLENLQPDDNVLILEMGARHKNDIDYLCKMYGVDYGIITSIGAQHLETFKNLETIEETKSELANNASQFTVFGGESTIKAYEKCEKNKILVGVKESFCYISDEKITSEGSSFILHLDGKELYAKTKLLGSHNLHDIVCAASLARLLKVPYDEIVDAIGELKPISHRLELIKTDFFTILDDSYNCNIVGAKEALKVLSKFDGKKIVITPGIVEMGAKQYEVNYNFAKQIACIADFVIVMNEVNKKALVEGLLAGGFEEKNITYHNDLTSAMLQLKEKVDKNSCILFENDLPDNYK